MLQEQADWDKRACLKVERLQIVDEWMFSCSAPTKTPSVVSEKWGGGLLTCSNKAVISGSWVQRRGAEGQMNELSASDLLLEGSLCSPGSSISGGRLYRFVRHDACGKFLLCLLKAGTGGTVHPVDLFEHDERQDSQRGKESSNEDHYKAHWDAFIQASQS